MRWHKLDDNSSTRRERLKNKKILKIDIKDTKRHQAKKKNTKKGK